MARLTVLGACGYVGGSGLLFEDMYGNKTVIDYGTKVSDNPPSFPSKVEGVVKNLVLSHCHMDHSAGAPLLVGNNYVENAYANGPTKELVGLLSEDFLRVNNDRGIDVGFDESDVKTMMSRIKTLDYRKPVSLSNDTEIELFDAGHIPGSAMVSIKIDGKSVLYTGDFNAKKTRLQNGCDEDLPRDIDMLVIESTYYGRDHPERESQEQRLADIINGTLEKGGTAVVAGFGVARLDEVLLALDANHITEKYDVYLDGMARKESKILQRHPYALRDHGKYVGALEKVNYVKKFYQREEISRNPSVVLTTGGMLQGGPVVDYLKRLDESSSLVLTGYQAEDTPGRKLLDTGYYIDEENGISFKVNARVEQLNFSGHTDGSGLIDFVKKVNPKKVLCVHGDNTEGFAQKLRELGFDAVAPSRERRVFEI